MSEEKEEGKKEEKVKVRTGVTKNKNEIFKKEQQEVAEKLSKILGITQINTKFSLEALKKDEEKLRQIMMLEEDVKQYFVYSGWSNFKIGVNNEAISMMRSIYRNTGYEINYKQKQKNGEKYTEYNIIKKPLGQ